MRVVTVKLQEAFLKGINELIDAKIYPSRSEAIRVAVRDLLKKELPGWNNISSNRV
ncbi:MAG: ribbon-helix-helix domain-containing protein [Candidatus Ranarchaeia archaeon]|jgi:Arc/MetJ-type ribon-helix-helix transcriptional regulator